MSDVEAEMPDADLPDDSSETMSNDDNADFVDALDKQDESYEYGCKHYQCRCAYVSPCCNKVYTCRICHDDSETHEINRHNVVEIECIECKARQPVAQKCVKCEVQFGRYFCAICRLFDDKDKQQFHCDSCGICRVGGRENFFHCPKCDMCLSIGLKDHHKCVEKATRTNCPVCLEDLHTSRAGLAVLRCGHICHRICHHRLCKTGSIDKVDSLIQVPTVPLTPHAVQISPVKIPVDENYTCPICCESMFDMHENWQLIDNEIANTPMPDEYKDAMVWILCRDCHKTCETHFHVVGLKCLDCGSYNTCRAEDPSSHCAATQDQKEAEAFNEDEQS